MGTQLRHEKISVEPDEDAVLGLDLAWDIDPWTAAPIRSWLQRSGLARPRRVVVYRRRDGRIVVTVKQSNRVDRKPTKVTGLMLGGEQSDWTLLWASRHMTVGPDVSSVVADHVRLWALRRWKAPRLSLTVAETGGHRIYMPATPKRPAFDEILPLGADVRDLYKRWRAYQTLRGT